MVGWFEDSAITNKEAVSPGHTCTCTELHPHSHRYHIISIRKRMHAYIQTHTRACTHLVNDFALLGVSVETERQMLEVVVIRCWV